MMIHEPVWRTLTLLLGVIAFGAGNAYAEVMRTLDPADNPISAYLTGPYGKWESGGFVAFAASLLVLLGRGPVWWQAMVAVTALSLLVVVLTKWLMRYGLYGWLGCSTSGGVEVWHLSAAGIAFTLAVGVEAAILWPSGWVALPLAAPVSALGFSLLDRSQTAIEEKTYTLLLYCGMLAAISVLLR